MNEATRKMIEDQIREHFTAVGEHIFASFQRPRNELFLDAWQIIEDPQSDDPFSVGFTGMAVTSRRRKDGLTPFIETHTLSLHTKTPENFNIEIDAHYWDDDDRQLSSHQPISITIRTQPDAKRKQELYTRFGPLTGLDEALDSQGESTTIYTGWEAGDPSIPYRSHSHLSRTATAQVRDAIPDMPKEISDLFHNWSAKRLAQGAKKGAWVSSLPYLWRAVHILEILTERRARNPDNLFSKDTLDKVRDLYAENPATRVEQRNMDSYLNGHGALPMRAG